MKKIVIGEILKEEQIIEITDYINEQAKEGNRATDTKVITGLKGILAKWKDELALLEIDSDYLAYALAFEMGKKQILFMKLNQV